MARKTQPATPADRVRPSAIARALDMTVHGVRLAIFRGELPATRLPNGRYMVDRAEALAYVTRKRANARSVGAAKQEG